MKSALRIFAGLVFALAIPFALCAQDGVVVSYDGYAGFKGRCGPPRIWSCSRSTA